MKRLAVAAWPGGEQLEKLHRPVALRVLPPEAVADEERKLRFLREARAAASVTHPNIATIHEIDEVDGIVFIAMEYIEGRPLRAVIAVRRPGDRRQ